MATILRKNTPIVLTADQFRMCTDLANLRGISNRDGGIPNGRISQRSDYFIEVNGLAGEVAQLTLLLQFNLIDICAFAWSLNMIKSTIPRSARRGDDEGDMVLDSGWTVDAKTTHYSYGELPVRYTKRYAPLIKSYTLITGDFEVSLEYIFRGYLDGEQMMRDFNKMLGRSQSAWWPQGELVHMHRDPRYPSRSAISVRTDQEVLSDPSTWLATPLSANWCECWGLPDINQYSTYTAFRTEYVKLGQLSFDFCPDYLDRLEDLDD